MKKFVRVVGQIFLYLIYFVIVMVSARLFAQWSVPLLVAQFPFLIFLTPLFVVATFALFLSKRLREKIKKVFLNLFKKTTIKGFLLPKNKFSRFAVNVGFIPFWFYIYDQFFVETIENLFDIDQDHFLMYAFLLIPIFFYTRYLWFEKSRSRTFFGIFDKLKFNLKQFNTDVFNTISNADELKKYADLRDQGIITEEEFQAKKKILLDL